MGWGSNAHVIMFKGITKRIYEMVDRIVCDFDSWCVGLSSCDIRGPNYFRRTSDSSLVLVFRVFNGYVYSNLR